MAEPVPTRVAKLLRGLKVKESTPTSANNLNKWIAHAESALGEEVGGGRLGWLIASSVAIAAIQRAVDNNGNKLFLLKGGTLLQHRLDAPARTTKDIDGLIRGDIEQFLGALDEVFLETWGPFTLRRGEVEVINVETRVLKPRRFDVFIELRGSTWRRVQIEISPDEAGIGEEFESVEAPPLGAFGLPDPEKLVGISLHHQIAQKLHAVSDPHDPPTSRNDRPRDIVDLILLRDLASSMGYPSNQEIANAAERVFDARATDANALGLEPRYWPPVIISHAHWGADYAKAASEVGMSLSLTEAVKQVNNWVAELSN